MESIIFTQLSARELQGLIREALQATLSQLPVGPAAPEHDLLTARGASKLLNLALPTIYSLVSQNTLPYMKRCNRLYFSKKELLDWVCQARQATTTELRERAAAHFKQRAELQKE